MATQKIPPPLASLLPPKFLQELYATFKCSSAGLVLLARPVPQVAHILLQDQPYPRVYGFNTVLPVASLSAILAVPSELRAVEVLSLCSRFKRSLSVREKFTTGFVKREAAHKGSSRGNSLLGVSEIVYSTTASGTWCCCVQHL